MFRLCSFSGREATRNSDLRSSAVFVEHSAEPAGGGFSWWRHVCLDHWLRASCVLQVLTRTLAHQAITANPPKPKVSAEYQGSNFIASKRFLTWVLIAPRAFQPCSASFILRTRGSNGRQTVTHGLLAVCHPCRLPPGLLCPRTFQSRQAGHLQREDQEEQQRSWRTACWVGPSLRSRGGAKPTTPILSRFLFEGAPNKHTGCTCVQESI